VADESPRAIIDPGTDYELLGGFGWNILGYHGRSTKLDGTLAGMSGAELPVVTVATAYDHPDPRIGTVIYLSAAFDNRIEQKETLLNSHELRKCGVIVDDKAKRDGVEQMIEVDGIKIPLDFSDERILSINLRRPIDQEHSEKKFHWLIPEMPDSEPRSLIRRHRTALEGVPEKSNDRS
jgi:hypothetical protein